MSGTARYDNVVGNRRSGSDGNLGGLLTLRLIPCRQRSRAALP
jgi:hypothetical protein